MSAVATLANGSSHWPESTLARFPDRKPSGDGQWMARCPIHDDNRESLSIGVGMLEGVRSIGVHCHAGCDTKLILAHYGLKYCDLFPPRESKADNIVAAYDYRDEAGELLFQVVRKAGKQFPQRKPMPGGGWEWRVKGVRQVVYRLPELLAADPAAIVFKPEGEKDADNLRSRGLVATTNPGGAHRKWQESYTKLLHGRRVVILPDNDGIGRQHAAQVATSLYGKAASVKILELPDLPPKGDVSNWLDAGGTAEQLLRMAAEAPEWDPANLGSPEVEDDDAIGVVQIDSRNDAANAERFAAEHGHRVRFIHDWKQFNIYNSRRWQRDDSGEIMRRAKQTADGIYKEAAKCGEEGEQRLLAGWAKSSHSLQRLNAMIELAKSEQPIPASHDSFDADPWLLNCDNGTVDLRTGRLQPHNPGDLLTKTTGVEYPDEPGVDAILWQEFLDSIFAGDVDLIRFLQRLMGSALTGEVIEHLLPIFHGNGANGKSVFIETAMAAMGEYAMKAPAGLLIASHGERHPTELADLYGKRLVAITETGDGQRLDERLVKELTGADTIRARRMREDFWQFRPSHTAVLVTNHRPIVRGVDHGIWRRLRLVPFNVTIAEADQDKRLPHKLRGELPAILRWMVDGCIAWQHDGLQAPPQVMAATEGYRTESDTFGLWFDECMKVAPTAEVRAAGVFKLYQQWCEAANERPLNRMRFGLRMDERIVSKRKSNGVMYLGVDFADDDSI